MKIWVDDIRPAPEGWVHLYSSWGAIAYFIGCQEAGKVPKIVSLDHDLGGDDTSRPIVLWCCENDWWPDKMVVHSANPVGREWLEGMINRYHPTSNADSRGCDIHPTSSGTAWNCPFCED